MTIDEALLYDAEWCVTNTDYEQPFATEIYKLLDIHQEWGRGQKALYDEEYRNVYCYFNLLIREAIKC